MTEWSKVLFSDESPFEVDASPNHQNDRILAHNPVKVPNHERNKFPGKLMVWGGRGLTKLHVVPNKTSITAESYHGVILEEYLLPVYGRTKSTGKISERKMVDPRLNSIFMQDVSHSSKLAGFKTTILKSWGRVFGLLIHQTLIKSKICGPSSKKSSNLKRWHHRIWHHSKISPRNLVKNQGGNPDKFGSVYARPSQVSNQSVRKLCNSEMMK